MIQKEMSADVTSYMIFITFAAIVAAPVLLALSGQLIEIIGNIVARKIPVLIAANKIDMKRASIKKIQAAFPEYDVTGISAKYGKNMAEFYESLFEIVKRR